MGISTTPIAFFSDEITIKPHTASRAYWIDKEVSIRDYARCYRVSLDRVEETGEYIVTRADGDFIQGPEV